MGNNQSGCVLHEALREGFDHSTHLLFTVGHHVFTTNLLGLREFTPAQKAAILRVDETMRRGKLSQITVTLKKK